MHVLQTAREKCAAPTNAAAPVAPATQGNPVIPKRDNAEHANRNVRTKIVALTDVMATAAIAHWAKPAMKYWDNAKRVFPIVRE